MTLARWQKFALVGATAAVILIAASSASAADYTGPLSKDERTATILAAAAEYSIAPAVALAVFAIESSGGGFASDGRMIIRFEPKPFTKYTGASIEVERGGQGAEWRNFDAAYQIDPDSCMLSISMGIAQIMGFNYKSVGYSTVGDMFAALSGSEVAQIRAFFAFVQSHGIVDAARTGDWLHFATVYNGSGQKGYDTKLANKYAYYVAQGYQGI